MELTESFTTNVSLIATTNNDYNMDLVETRQRDTFTKDGLGIVVYIGNVGEKYNDVDFSGSSVREVINCPLVWQKNKNGDKVGHSVPFSPAALNALLENNKGNSTWADDWHPLSLTPGIYIKRTADKSRMAIAYGVSENEIHRLRQVSRLNPRPLSDQAAGNGVEEGASSFGALSVGVDSGTAAGGASSSSVKER